MTDLQNPLVAAYPAADGNETRLRSERTRGLVMQAAHAPLYEETNQGNSWTISTAVAGITTTALMVVSTASAIPIVGLFNPDGSGKNLIVHRAIVCQVTGTSTGFIWGVAADPAMTASDGVATGRNNKTFASGGHIGRAFAGATAMVGTGVTYRSLGEPVAGIAYAAGLDTTFRDDVDGEIVVVPGNFVGVFATVAMAANIVRASLTWAEVPI